MLGSLNNYAFSMFVFAAGLIPFYTTILSFSMSQMKGPVDSLNAELGSFVNWFVWTKTVGIGVSQVLLTIASSCSDSVSTAVGGLLLLHTEHAAYGCHNHCLHCAGTTLPQATGEGSRDQREEGSRDQREEGSRDKTATILRCCRTLGAADHCREILRNAALVEDLVDPLIMLFKYIYISDRFVIFTTILVLLGV